MDVLARPGGTATNGLSSQGPSSGPLLYQPDLLLLKCAKNGLRYRSQRLSSQKEFNGQKPIRIEPVQLGLQLEPLCMGEPEIVLGDNPTKVVQLFERNDREKRSVIDQKLKGQNAVASDHTRSGPRPGWAKSRRNGLER